MLLRVADRSVPVGDSGLKKRLGAVGGCPLRFDHTKAVQLRLKVHQNIELINCKSVQFIDINVENSSWFSV